MSRDFLRRMALTVCLLILLSGCGADRSVLATMKDRTITVDEFLREDRRYQALLNTQSSEEPKETVDVRRTRVLRQMIYDALIRTDAKYGEGLSIDISKARQSLIEKWGSEKALSTQLAGYGLNEEDLRSLLEKEEYARRHRERFDAANQPSAQQLQSYFSSHKSQIVQVSFDDVIVPSRSEAEEVRAALLADGKALEEYRNRFNHDVFTTTDVRSVDHADRKNPQMPDEAVLEQDPKEISIYYDNGAYHVVRIRGREDSFEALAESAKKQYLADAYTDYLQNLSKEKGLKIYSEHIPQESSEETSSESM